MQSEAMLGTACAALALGGCVSVTETAHTAPLTPVCVVGSPMVETMLFLGMATPTGSVSEEQFAGFVEKEVAPRWKEGLTMLNGQGLWYSEQRHVTEHEPSRVLVRVHDGTPAAPGDIQAIRQAYIKAFNQDAVLRTDRQTCADF